MSNRKTSTALPIYPVLPPMRCDHGCGECCGPTMASIAEYDAIQAFAKQNGITPKRQGLKCPFYQEGTCKVYPVRPMICRLYGHSKKTPCARGYNTNIPRKVEEKLLVNYVRKYSPDILLHGLVYTDEEIMRLINTRELAATERDTRLR